MRTNRFRVALVAALAALISMTGLVAPARAATGAAAIEGQVLSWMEPLAGAKVTVVSALSGRPLASAVSDVNGDYRVSGVPAGVPVKVTATKPGYFDAWANQNSWASAQVYTLQPGQVLSQTWDPVQLYLDLTPEAVLTGTVLGVNRSTGCTKPLRHAVVTVVSVGTGTVVERTRTNRAGEFRIGMLRGGTVVIKAQKRGWTTTWAPAATQPADAQRFDLVGGLTTEAGTITMTAKRPWRACGN